MDFDPTHPYYGYEEFFPDEEPIDESLHFFRGLLAVLLIAVLFLPDVLPFIPKNEPESQKDFYSAYGIYETSIAGTKDAYVFRVNLNEGSFKYFPTLSYDKTIFCEVFTNNAYISTKNADFFVNNYIEDDICYTLFKLNKGEASIYPVSSMGIAGEETILHEGVETVIFSETKGSNTGFVYFEMDGQNPNPSHGIPYRTITPEPILTLSDSLIKEYGFIPYSDYYWDGSYVGYKPINNEVPEVDPTLLPAKPCDALMNCWIDYANPNNWGVEESDEPEPETETKVSTATSEPEPEDELYNAPVNIPTLESNFTYTLRRPEDAKDTNVSDEEAYSVINNKEPDVSHTPELTMPKLIIPETDEPEKSFETPEPNEILEFSETPEPAELSETPTPEYGPNQMVISTTVGPIILNIPTEYDTPEEPEDNEDIPINLEEIIKADFPKDDATPEPVPEPKTNTAPTIDHDSEGRRIFDCIEISDDMKVLNFKNPVLVKKLIIHENYPNSVVKVANVIHVPSKKSVVLIDIYGNKISPEFDNGHIKEDKRFFRLIKDGDIILI